MLPLPLPLGPESGNTAGFKSKVTLRFRPAVRWVAFFVVSALAFFGVDVDVDVKFLPDVDGDFRDLLDEFRDKAGFREM